MNECSIDACSRVASVRGMCLSHYQSWNRRQPPGPESRLCEVEGCQNKHYSKAMCHMHYLRVSRHGTTKLKNEEKPENCSTFGCDNSVVTKGMCKAHYSSSWRDARIGAKEVNIKHHAYKAEVKYNAAHERVRLKNGRADGKLCIDCGSQAKEWSLTHHSESWRVEVGGPEDGKIYSLAVEDYEPRCRSCHVKFDFPLGYLAGPHLTAKMYS